MSSDNNQENVVEATPSPSNRLAAGVQNLNSNEELVELLGVMFFHALQAVNSKLIGPRSLSLYNARTSPYPQEIANMFGIDIQGETEEVTQALLAYPIFSKAFLGTQFGASKVLEPVLSRIEFKTHDNVPGMEPFRFVVRADNTAGLDQKKAVSLVNRFSSLRDNPAEIVLIGIICDNPYVIVQQMFLTQQRVYNIDQEECENG